MRTDLADTPRKAFLRAEEYGNEKQDVKQPTSKRY